MSLLTGAVNMIQLFADVFDGGPLAEACSQGGRAIGCTYMYVMVGHPCTS